MSSPDERTEEATPKRRQKERDKGNVPKSQDLNSALMVTTGVALLAVFSKHIISKINILFYETFTHLKPNSISTDDILAVLYPFINAGSQIILPFLLILMFTGIFIVRSQIGAIFAPEKIKFDLSNISPSKVLGNAKKMLNPVEPRNLVEFIKSMAKLLIVFMCGYAAVNSRKDELFALMGMNINTAFTVIGSILTQMLTNICLAMIVIGIIDKKYQDYEYNKSIKMTKQEIKDEFKQSEGDPKMKAKVRSIQMKMARNMMLSNIPKADVVVTNPTHYAVALKYDRLTTAAPQVVAKGIDFLAFKIREIAQENNIPIVENPPLARELYKLVPIDGIIPSDMFVAVAEVLAYVYNQNKGER